LLPSSSHACTYDPCLVHRPDVCVVPLKALPCPAHAAPRPHSRLHGLTAEPANALTLPTCHLRPARPRHTTLGGIHCGLGAACPALAIRIVRDCSMSRSPVVKVPVGVCCVYSCSSCSDYHFTSHMSTFESTIRPYPTCLIRPCCHCACSMCLELFPLMNPPAVEACLGAPTPAGVSVR
jgi:hypothetical protein